MKSTSIEYYEINEEQETTESGESRPNESWFQTEQEQLGKTDEEQETAESGESTPNESWFHTEQKQLGKTDEEPSVSYTHLTLPTNREV